MFLIPSATNDENKKRLFNMFWTKFGSSGKKVCIVQSKKGAFHLDQDYTIFGKVIKGMNVVDKISSVNTDDYDCPINNVYINKAEIID